MRNASSLAETLRDAYAPRHIKFMGINETPAFTCKEYEISTHESAVPSTNWQKARQLNQQFFDEPIPFERTGLGTIIVHAGADGEYILLHEWIEGFMSRQRIFIRNETTRGAFVAAPEGLAPCVWERAVYDHENTVYRNLLTSNELSLDRALAAWKASTYSGVW